MLPYVTLCYPIYIYRFTIYNVTLYIMNIQEFSTLSQAEKNKALLRYVRNEDVDNIRSALKQGANVNYATPQGYTPLYESAGIGNKQIISMLLDAGAEIDVPGDEYNGPPLIWAAAKGDVNSIKLLLEKGGNINIKHEKNGSGNTPLHVASSNTKDDAILFLVRNGADLTIQNEFLRRPLDIIAEKYIEIHDKKIIQWEKTIQIQEKEKERLQRIIENQKNKDNLKRLESDLTSKQKYLDQSKSYIQPLIVSKKRGENLIKTVIEKALEQKIPLEKITIKPVVKKLYAELMKVRDEERQGVAEVVVRHGLPEKTLSKELLSYVHKGGKQKKRKTRKSKKYPSKNNRKTSKKRKTPKRK